MNPKLETIQPVRDEFPTLQFEIDSLENHTGSW